MTFAPPGCLHDGPCIMTSNPILVVTTRPVKPVNWSCGARMTAMSDLSWVSGQETKPAPMPLLLVQSFVNTWDGDHGSDLLLDPEDARAWLTAAGLWNTDRAPQPAELDLARRVRESIRAMLTANRGGSPASPGELQAIQVAAQASRTSLRIGPDGVVSLQ